jgi:hypothetical protein
VQIQNQHLLLDQPELIPVLTFACQEFSRGNNGARNQVSIVCLDKRNGRKIYDGKVGNIPSAFDMVADPKQHTVELRMQQQTVAMTFTDKPIVPKPAAAPAATGPEAAKPEKTSAAGALGRAIGKALGLPLGNKKSPEDDQ